MSAHCVISVDGACSGKRAACAAVLALDGKVVAERSRYLPQVDGYALAAEIAGVALAGELLDDEGGPLDVTIEMDNPDGPHDIGSILNGGFPGIFHKTFSEGAPGRSGATSL